MNKKENYLFNPIMFTLNETVFLNLTNLIFFFLDTKNYTTQPLTFTWTSKFPSEKGNLIFTF